MRILITAVVRVLLLAVLSLGTAAGAQAQDYVQPKARPYGSGSVGPERITDGASSRFKGCGILDSCYGDLFVGSCLYEVKCVERNLRSIDIRQVLTYCALNYQSQQITIDEVSIVNPRRGIAFRYGVEALAQQVSGKNSAELFHQIGDFLMNFETIQRPS